MEILFDSLPYDALTLLAIVGIFLAGGLVKGTVGFGLPLIVVSLLVAVVPVRDALAMAVLPGLAANLWLAIENHRRLRVAGRRFWPLVITLVGGIVIGAAVVVNLDQTTLFLILGSAIILFSLISEATPKLTISPRQETAMSLLVGCAAGVLGGISTVFGPLIVMYFVTLRLGVETYISSIGLVFTAGSIITFAAFSSVGIMRLDLAVLSLVAFLPAGLGLYGGKLLRDRVNERLFRRIVLAALLISGLNLIRKAVL